VGHKQPPAETFFDGMKLVANSRLGDLHGESVGVLKQKPMKTFLAIEFPAKRIALYLVGSPGNLYDRPKRRHVAQNGAYSHDLRCQ
jgi:hypothetical protein